MNETHPVDVLSEKLKRIDPSPAGVVPVPERIASTAFFPGGAGLWGAQPGEPLPPMPTGKIMILGQDFHSETGYWELCREPGRNLHDPTWRTLRSVLQSVGVSLRDCFFTNLFMGLRQGKETTGRFPGARNRDFTRQCCAFLAEQIRIQQPRLIVTLGRHVPAKLASLSHDLSRWAVCRTFKEIDQKGGPIVHPVRFDVLPARGVTVVALTHPSLRGPNVARRRYQHFVGDDAELALLREGLQTSGLDRIL
jgi:uracil-DNA glycosylase family 4